MIKTFETRYLREICSLIDENDFANVEKQFRILSEVIGNDYQDISKIDKSDDLTTQEKSKIQSIILKRIRKKGFWGSLTKTPNLEKLVHDIGDSLKQKNFGVVKRLASELIDFEMELRSTSKSENWHSYKSISDELKDDYWLGIYSRIDFWPNFNKEKKKRVDDLEQTLKKAWNFFKENRPKSYHLEKSFISINNGTCQTCLGDGYNLDIENSVISTCVNCGGSGRNRNRSKRSHSENIRLDRKANQDYLDRLGERGIGPDG